MNAYVPAAEFSTGRSLSPYAAIAAGAARPSRRSPFVVATIDLIAIVVAVGVIQVVNGMIMGGREVPPVSAAEQPPVEAVAAPIPPMPRLADRVPMVPAPMGAEAILFAEPVAFEGTFGPAVAGPAPGRFAILDTRSAGSGTEPSRRAQTVPQEPSANGPLLSYDPDPVAESTPDDGPVASRVVATVAAVDSIVDEEVTTTGDVVSSAVSAIVSSGNETAAGVAAAVPAAAPVVSTAEQIPSQASSRVEAASQSTSSTVSAATTTTTSAVNSVASGASSAVSQATGVVGGLLD